MPTKKTNIGALIKALRAAKGLTQEWVSGKAKLERKYLGRLEKGRSSPTLRKLESIVEAMDSSLYELFTLKRPRVQNNPLQDVPFEDLKYLQLAVKIFKSDLENTKKALRENIDDFHEHVRVDEELKKLKADMKSAKKEADREKKISLGGQ